MTVRLAFLGNDPWSVPPLEAIAGEPELEPVLTLTNKPKPAGRGSEVRSTAVADAARRLGIPLLEVDGVRSGAGLDALIQVRPDVVVVVAFGELLTHEVLELPPLGAINLHFSLLPRWRGAAPVQHALLAGDARTGVSVMRMDEGLDTGPILNQLEEDIRPDDDAGMTVGDEPVSYVHVEGRGRSAGHRDVGICVRRNCATRSDRMGGQRTLCRIDRLRRFEPREH